ncbi:MAG: helix-turn-helix domain-containing protein [Micavibrio sp.]|nr:helix-turn-helix domain-containing protein [Micavibrio sp.]
MKENKMITEELISKDEARKALGGIGNTKFYQLLNAGEIQAVKIGKSLRVRRSEIERFIKNLPSYKNEGE